MQISRICVSKREDYMETTITIIAIILIVFYFIYRIFWGSIWIFEKIRKNEEYAEVASKRMTGLISFVLLVAMLFCIFIYELLEK
jgi:hypothetical protein